ncbi:unannotated protein [freshwater metagenome]|uniref:Unannotated protein n=1 Tax=freshwater metagenome TaxID=449393 RepID=A0A6J7JP65_9ZZZZ|nr:hypothetical protein [Actinomycetota bacterium]
MTPGAPRTFPALQVRSLDGRLLQLPADLPGELNLIILAFERRQQDDVDSWLAGLAGLAEEHPQIELLELPCISRRWTAARWFIDGGMAAAIKAPEALARTLTAYTDVDAVLLALGHPGRDAICPLLTDRSGTVFWQGAGPYQPALARTLRETLRGVPRRS